MRVFLDTNVLVSALATRGLCADVLGVVLLEHDLVVGERVLAELRRLLRQKMRVPAAAVDEVEALLRSQGEVVTASAQRLIKARDPADARVLAEAVTGKVDILVTGDRDLLEVASKAPFPIVTPRGFWDALRSAPRR